LSTSSKREGWSPAKGGGAGLNDVRDLTRLLSINDPVLAPLISAVSEEEQRIALEEIVVKEARPVVTRVLSRYRGATDVLDGDDLEDVASMAMLRLVRRLQAARMDPHEAVARLDDFAATIAYNAAYDFMRRRSPARTRLKNRVRYVLTRDKRFSTFDDPRGQACTAAGWPVSPVVPIAIATDAATPAMLDRERVGDAIEAVIGATGRPILVEDLVRFLAEAWGIGDDVDVPASMAGTPASQAARFENRQYLATLWRAIRELRPPQRAALLFNLRDVDGGNAVALFGLVGITSIDEIAEAMGVTTDRLAELWNDLPLDDLRIAAMLGVSRQQVINFRKSARVALSRRMKDLA
jgi:RNA polymerase sigma factor (sigma-70 family)